MTEERQVRIEDVQAAELPEFDPTPYIGKQAMIDTVEIKDGNFGKYVEFKALVDARGYHGEPLYATRIIGLQEMDGKIVWGTRSKMQRFLEAHKVKHPSEMKGKMVVVTKKEDTTYLSF